MSQPPQYSADGRWWWDGQRWVPATGGGIVPPRPNRFPWGVYGLLGCGAVAFLLVVAIVVGSVLFSSRSTQSTAAQTPSPSPIAKASLNDLQVVAQGIGSTSPWPIGVAIKDASTTYAFVVTYLATYYDSQGAQVGTTTMSELDILPGGTIVLGDGFEPTLSATPVRFALTLSSQAPVRCAYPVLKRSQVPAPIAPVSGTWTVNPQNPDGSKDYLPSGTVNATLQVPSARNGLVAQALLTDTGGHLTGFGEQQLTVAQGATPVRIVVQDSQVVLGQDPWGQVSTVSVLAHDDFRQLFDGGTFGECQAL